MKVAVIGGGPGGLYFGVLMKRAAPDADIHIYERNRADDTFGWGVVFSDETLHTFEEADAESYRAITSHFNYWNDIDIHFGGQIIRSSGHGFCGISRKVLLQLLQARCRELGVDMTFEIEVDGLEPYDDADLIVAADGVKSKIRDGHADVFKPDLLPGKAKFIWLGTTQVFEAFTFIIRENEHGLFQVHAYPFDTKTSTFIIETDEQTWRRAGLDKMSTDESVAYCERLFASELGGHRLLTNKSDWVNFLRVKNDTWRSGNVVLIGDAAHTAHFSIGSGTKLAMEDVIALVRALEHNPNVEQALAEYEDVRWVDAAKLQKTASVSQQWFEEISRYKDDDPIQMAVSLLTRSKRVTHHNLQLRDPEFIARVDRWFADRNGCRDISPPPPPMFTPFSLREMDLHNRVVVSSMCQYSAVDGTPNDWHLVHLGSRAMGGAALVMAEMTDISAPARITPGCAGLYRDEHVAAWKRIVDFVHQNTRAKVGMQLAHAGRKGSTKLMWEGSNEPLPAGNWPLLSASAIPFHPHSQVPKEMDRADMDEVVRDFVTAAERADQAGFDMLELHMAHGYLLACFISPLTNVRTDDYGGSLAARMRFPLEVFDAVRGVWPDQKPMSVRISAVDWAEGGMGAADAVEVARLLQAHGCDIVDVSSGQTVDYQEPNYGRMYQTPFADRIRHELGMPTMAVGAIQGWDHINTILAAGRADLCALARPHLYDPYLALHAAREQQWYDVWWPNQYLLAKPAPPDPNANRR